MLSDKYQQYLTQEAIAQDESKISVYKEGGLDQYNTTPIFEKNQQPVEGGGFDQEEFNNNFEFKDTADEMVNVLKEFTIRDVENKNIEIYKDDEESKIRIYDQEYDQEEAYI